MKKIKIITILSVVLLLTLQQTANAQEAKTVIKNEIKINLLNSVLAMPEVNYERLLQSNMSIGLALGFGVGKGTEDDFSQYKFLATPYYRVYFGDTDGAGFFIEGNAGIGNVQSNNVYYPSVNYQMQITSQTVFSYGLGAAIGKKFLTKNNFLGEIFGGVGRFFNSNATVEVYPRVGISLGKRF